MRRPRLVHDLLRAQVAGANHAPADIGRGIHRREGELRDAARPDLRVDLRSERLAAADLRMRSAREGQQRHGDEGTMSNGHQA
jgi:hypothetical protein